MSYFSYVAQSLSGKKRAAACLAAVALVGSMCFFYEALEKALLPTGIHLNKILTLAPKP